MANAALNFSQQEKLFPSNAAKPVTLVGAGSVGSNAADILARIGVTDITAYDADAIESHNIPPSLYRIDDLGRYKVDALAEILRDAVGVSIRAKRVMYGDERPIARLKGSVLACVDTMGARKTIWDAAKKNPFVDILVDTRVATQFRSIFFINPCDPSDIDYYEHFLAYGDEEAAPQLCGFHNIATIARVVAGEAVDGLANFWVSGRKVRHFEGVIGQQLFFPQEEA